VNSNWGGTQIESWMSDAALRADPAAPEIFARWQKVLADYPAKVAAHGKAVAKWAHDAAAAKAAGQPFTRRKPAVPEGPGSRWQPSGMYHAMIAPLAPAALRGVLWYQGEANGARAAEYRTLFPGLIRQWRTGFGQPNLPFYFVQLANFARPVDKSDQQWAFLREAQAGALALPATGMAVTIEIGDPTNIHPKNKQEVGRRLALLARAQLGGETIEFAGPVFVAAKPEGGALRVSFTHAAGLRLGGAGPTGFEVAGEDRKFVPAAARIEGDSLLVSAGVVPHPVAVRYAWRNAPPATLFNLAGLPAAPFRSDTW
jgi:sialate O-acetylesterase